MKMLKMRRTGLNVVGYTNLMASYGKVNDNYRIEINPLPFINGGIWIQIWNKTTKPKFRNITLLAATVAVFVPLVTILGICFFFVTAYAMGAKNYILNSHNSEYTRFFNFTNIVFMFILAIALLSTNM